MHLVEIVQFIENSLKSSKQLKNPFYLHQYKIHSNINNICVSWHFYNVMRDL